MIAGQKVRLLKIDTSDNPEYPAAEWANYKFGGYNPGVSLPIEYSVEGYLITDIQIGNSIVINRTKRNEEITGGHLKSSPVEKIENKVIHTNNSRYVLEVINEKS